MQAQNTNLMTEGDFRRKIILFTIPILIGRLFQQLYNTADSFIVGNFIGSNALAAVSSTGSLVYLIVGFFNGFSLGAGIIVARYIGARDEERSRRAVHSAIAIGLLLGIVMSAAGVLITDPLLHLISTPDEVFADASIYLKIYFAGAFSLIMYNMFVSILQANGDSKNPLIYLIISSLINIVLDIVFITAFHMGVAGAAFATILSEFISAVLSFARLLKSDEYIRFRPRCLRLDRQDLKDIFYYGMPTAMQASVIDLSNLLIQAYINSFGAAAMAGIGASSKMEGFAFLPIIAFSQAMSTYVSQNIGAGDRKRAWDGIKFGEVLALLTIETIGVFFFIFAPSLIALFSQETAVIAYGVIRMRTVALFYCLLGFSHVTSAIMRGVGKPVVPMLVMLLCWCAVRVAAIYTIGQTIHTIYFVVWLYPITWTISTVVYLIYGLRLAGQYLRPAPDRGM